MRVSSKFLTAFLLFSIPFVASALKMTGKHYQGIAKNTDGSPVEFWVDLEFDDEDASVSIGEAYSFIAPYKISGTDKKTIISTRLPGFGTPLNFVTTDGGESLTAEFDVPDEKRKAKLNLWVLKVPRKLKKTTSPYEETLNTITDKDGYTCFIKINRGELEYCVTADAFFNSGGGFSVEQDGKMLSAMFSDKLTGTFKVDGADISLSLSGSTYKGTIYDEGNYIQVPLGQWESSTGSVTLILIK